MYNRNGQLTDENIGLVNNRGLLFGDAVFETLKIVDGKVLFLEDHYFRLMSAMRIVRMDIPMDYTMEFLEHQILKTADSMGCLESGRVRLTVYRDSTGLYRPESNDVAFVASASMVSSAIYLPGHAKYEVDLYKDFYITRQLLSTIKTTNRILNVAGSIFAEENGLQNCLLLNDAKNVAEALNGNLFLLIDGQLRTPPISEGCLNGVMRKQILTIAGNMTDLKVEESILSPFDLQKADEMFITNVIGGIQSVSRYRKKDYGFEVADRLRSKLNEVISGN